MSAINTNAFSTGFPNVPITSELPASGSGSAPMPPIGSKDSIAQLMPSGSFGPLSSGYPAAGGSSDGGLAGFGNIMNGFINALQNLLSSLAGQFGLSSGPGQSGTPAAPELHYANATASSVGDPHDGFDGTKSSGGTVDRKWDNMQSHADLLDSDSFDGGYRVSTTATAANGAGVTLNASAGVTLDGGATKVTLSGDGSSSVTANGQNVSLVAGQAVALGNGESVTLGADKSLTVSDRNAAGGSISTVLSTNGSGGVDVKNSASDVDLGGYLVTHSDSPQAGPWPLRDAGAGQAGTAYQFRSTPGDPTLQEPWSEFA